MFPPSCCRRKARSGTSSRLLHSLPDEMLPRLREQPFHKLNYHIKSHFRHKCSSRINLTSCDIDIFKVFKGLTYSFIVGLRSRLPRGCFDQFRGNRNRSNEISMQDFHTYTYGTQEMASNNNHLQTNRLSPFQQIPQLLLPPIAALS